MEKRITTAITYHLPIEDLDCAKNFLLEVDEVSKSLHKSPYWVAHAKHVIKGGLKVVFLHLWTNEDQWFGGLHYREQMVFEVLIGFDSIGSEMYSIGELGVDTIEELCQNMKKIQISYLRT